MSVEQTDAQIHRVLVVGWKCHDAQALKPFINYTIETTVGDQGDLQSGVGEMPYLFILISDHRDKVR